MSNVKKYRNLVLAGGGIRGMAYIGAIAALRQLRVLDKIERVLGCSVGAIFALLVALDYTHEELHDILIHFDYFSIKDLDFLGLIDKWGVESGAKVEKFLNQLIKRKTDLNDPTFKELRVKTGNKELIVNAVAIDTFTIKYFSSEETPNIKVVKAIRASISLPGLLTPVPIDDHLYVDGGLLNNLPLDYFKAIGTLGLCLQQNTSAPTMLRLNNVKTYALAVLSCVYNTMEELRDQLRGKDYEVISIPTGDINTLQLHLSRTKRLFLYHHGEQAVLNYFRQKDAATATVATAAAATAAAATAAAATAAAATAAAVTAAPDAMRSRRNSI
jgi:predicted acylesterase/phospholipase RssA